MSTNRFCLIHIQRSIDAAIGTAGRSLNSLHARMFGLTSMLTEEEYYEHCEELIRKLFKPYFKLISNLFLIL